jgi:glycosyltransferase involved in cell wall biosynthesis
LGWWIGMNVEVSIIVPIYNSERYLDKCITSILNQEFTDFELILVNDGSKDNSQKICDMYAEKDDRIVVKHVKNEGVSSARNTGINLARGRYITFIDSDDFIQSDYILELHKNIIINSAQLSICAIKVFTDKVEKELNVGNGILDFNDVNKQLFLKLNQKFLLYAPYSKLYITEIIKANKIRFDNQISYGEDLIFNFMYYKCINKVSITDTTAYYYVQDNTESLSKKYRKDRFLMAKRIHLTLLDFFNEINLTDKQSYQLLYGRLFDDVYNSLFLINDQNFSRGLLNRFKYINSILKDNEINNCIKYADVSGYSGGIVSIIRLKSSMLFLFFNFFSKLKNRLKARF